MENFRNLFVNYLNKHAISQVEAGELMGMSQQGVSNLINGEGTIRSKTRRRIFDAFPEFEGIYNESKNDDQEDAVNDLKTLENKIEQLKGMLELINKGLYSMASNLDDHRDKVEQICSEINQKIRV